MEKEEKEIKTFGDLVEEYFKLKDDMFSNIEYMQFDSAEDVLGKLKNFEKNNFLKISRATTLMGIISGIGKSLMGLSKYDSLNLPFSMEKFSKIVEKLNSIKAELDKEIEE